MLKWGFFMEKKVKVKMISRSVQERTGSILVLFVFCFDLFGFTMPVMTGSALAYMADNQDNITYNVNSIPPVADHRIDLRNVIKTTKLTTFSAYTSEIAQCDASPCITATGFNLCQHGIEDTIAANFLPFGTKVRIPELFGERIFTVRDRMNRRYTNKVDIWMRDRSQAIQFGKKTGVIEIFGDIAN
jgi:3D (Asp-Asp-Asp) domain-containing protein